jgi:hypothetical protein
MPLELVYAGFRFKDLMVERQFMTFSAANQAMVWPPLPTKDLECPCIDD